MPTQVLSEKEVPQNDGKEIQTRANKCSRWRVNKQLLPLKMFYFFFYGASGSSIPFLTVYLKFLRLNASETGFIIGLSMLVAMLMRSVIGMAADKMSAKKTALLICCLGFGTSIFSLWFVPRRLLPVMPSAHSINYSSNGAFQQKPCQHIPDQQLSQGSDQGSDLQHLPNCTRHEFNGVYGEAAGGGILNVTTRNGDNLDQNMIPDAVFLFSFILLITGKSFYSAATSLVDAVTYTLLGPHKLLWGRQRLWGTVGTGIVVISVTVINGSQKVESFAGLFIVCLSLSAMAFLIGLIKLKVDKVPKNETFFTDLKRLLGCGAVRLFLCKLLFFGAMSGASLNFIFWFLVEIGSSHVTLGVCLVLYCLSSVVLLSCSSFVLHKMGAINIMYLTLLAYTVRYLLLSFLTIPWTALPIEVLQGVTYSLFWAAASATASLVAPAGTQVTSQAIAGAAYWDLGRGAGIVISGQLLHLFGTRWTFRAYSIACVCILPVFWALDRTWPLQKSAAENQANKKEQDGEVGAHLLQTDNTNGRHLLISSKDNATDLDIEKRLSVTNRDLKLPYITEDLQEDKENASEPHGMGQEGIQGHKH